MNRRPLASIVSTTALAIALATGTWSAAAHAGDGDKVGAQAAFDLGKKLMLEAKYAEACPKFEESLRLESGVGTMLFLADCYQRIGRTASAWAQFREAEGLASRANDQRAAVARDRADKIEPTLARLAIQVPASLRTMPGLQVKRDGVIIGAGVYDTPIPVDPGSHKISVGAQGKKTFKTEVTVAAQDTRAELKLPATLEDGVDADTPATSNAPSLEPPREAPKDGSTQRVIGIVLAGVGVVGIGVGSVFGLQAKSKLDDSNADEHCRGNICDPSGTDARNAARDAATVSTIGFIAGAVLVAGGLVLFFTAPNGASSKSNAAAFAKPRTSRILPFAIGDISTGARGGGVAWGGNL